MGDRHHPVAQAKGEERLRRRGNQARYTHGSYEDKLPRMAAELLDDEQIAERLEGLEGWDREGDAITKAFSNDDFVGSVEFVKKIVAPAEEMGHHPDLELSWDQVKVSITNHSAGGLTEADFELAKRIDGLRA